MITGGRVGTVGLLALLIGGPASAQDAAPMPGGLVQLVPPPPIVGGGGPVDLYLVALNPDGSPANGLVLKATRTEGMQSRWLEVGSGIYRMPFAPPAVDQPTTVVATAKGKLLTTGDKISLTASVQVAPPPVPLSLSASPASLVLGKDPQSSLQFAGVSRGVRTAVNVGSIEDLTPMAGGAEAARYVPPHLNYPHQAILAYADSTDPLDRYGFTIVPLAGSVEFPVKATAGLSVLLEIGDRKYGPVVAGADGKAKVPIEVPPGVGKATQVTVENGQEKREELDLKIPETRRIQLLPLPSSLPADPRASIPVRAIVALPTGGGDLAAKPVFTVSVGSVTEPVGKGDGLYEAIWHPAASPGAAEISVTLGGDLQVDKESTSLVSPRAGDVTLSSSVASIGPDTKAFDVTAKVVDSAGVPMTHATVLFDLTGAEQVGQVIEGEGGTYKVTLTPGPTGPVDVRARIAPMPSVEPVHDLLVVPSRKSVHDDGADAVDLLVAAVDAQGLPVADVAVNLDLAQGDGTIESKSLTTGRDGTARTRYVGGKTPAVVGIRASAADVTELTTLLQVPAGVPELALPSNEPPVDASRFTASLPTITIPRSAGVAVATAPAAVSQIRLAADQAAVKAGATLSVTVSPMDATGALTTAQAPDVVVTGASLASKTVNADGSVVVTATVPDPATLPVTVTAKAGDVSQTLNVPIDAGPWAGGAVASAAPVPVAPVPVAPVPAAVPVPAPPKANNSAQVPWFRARIAGIGSSYRYEQAPAGDPGPLLPSRLVVGGPDGGSAALPVGGEIDVRAWADQADLPYLGGHAQFRMGSYGISSSSFSAVARDVLTNTELDLLGRYPVDVNGERYWIGAKVGVHDNDFMAFEGCLDPGCQIDTSPVNVVGLALGAEVGADVGPVSFVGGYTLGLAQFSQPYSNALDLDLGYAVAGPVYVDAGFSMLARSIVLKGADTGLDRGSLNDSQAIFKLGAGVAF